MKESFKLFIILLICGIGIVSVTEAARYGGSYTTPTVSAPGDNFEVTPITVGPQDEAKAGSLTVTTFISRGMAWVKGETFFGGYLRGGSVFNPNDDATLMFGDDVTPVSISATGTIGTAYPQRVEDRSRLTFQSDTLTPVQGTTWSYVCADNQGNLTRQCPDRCDNIPGVQPSVPPDMILNGTSCVVELNPNSPTSCQYQMIARKLDDTHAKFTLEQNGSVYLYNPSNGSDLVYITIKFESGAIRTITAPKGQLPSYDFGAVTNHIRIINVQPATIGSGEVCWRGY